MRTSGVPQDLDDESLLRIARTFYVVKMVRYAALLLAALGVAALAASQGAPGWVAVTLVALAAAFVAAMVVTAGRYRRQAGSSPRS
jgi:hypothetical protein